MKRSIQFLIWVMAVFMLTACGNNESSTSEGQNNSTGTTSENASGTIVLEADDKMRFNLSEIRVKEGQKVRLSLKHTGTMSKAAMGHNFVLLKQDVDVADFGARASAAAETEYIPLDQTEKVIAHTKLLGGGESDTIEFTAPAKGTYPFICSFPGHFATMIGDFIVE